MLYPLRFFSSKCSLFHNANLFGSCIIHILYTGCAKIKKKKIPALKGETCEMRKWGKTKEKGGAAYEATTYFMA